MLYKNKRGFTLIELLVVIAIIGILSSVVLASLNTARQKSRDAVRLSDINQIQLALELYFDSQSPGTYPADLATLDTDGFIDLPTDPSDSSAYGYAQLDGGLDYCLGADLEDDSHANAQSDCTLTGFDHTVAP